MNKNKNILVETFFVKLFKRIESVIKMSETNEEPKTAKDKKGQEETIVTLRCELRGLYESLAEKNDQLLLLERDVRERDGSIKFLRSEFYKMREEQSTNHKNKLSEDNVVDSTTNEEGMECWPQKNNVVSNGDGAKLLGELQRKNKELNMLVTELSAKCIRLTHDLTYVQRKSFAKDDKIRELQNEIDKFRQVVRPLTQAMFERKRSDTYDEWSAAPGIESTRVLPLTEPRIKRQAISAEPLSAMAGMEGELVKIPKSSL